MRSLLDYVPSLTLCLYFVHAGMDIATVLYATLFRVSEI